MISFSFQIFIPYCVTIQVFIKKIDRQICQIEVLSLLFNGQCDFILISRNFDQITIFTKAQLSNSYIVQDGLWPFDVTKKDRDLTELPIPFFCLK